MRKVKKNIVKKQTGITIIALVITIVVLLILAGITIGAITGNNGIIGQAQTAKTNTEREQIREQIDVMVVQSIGKNGNVDKEVLMPKLETLPDGKEIYDTDEEIYIVYPEYTFKVDLGSGDVSIEDIEISKDETPWELAGSGTEEDPYLIESIEDLVSFSNDVNEGNTYSNKYVTLTKTLDFKSPLSYVNPKTKVSEKTTRIIKEDTDGEEILTFLTKEDGTGFNPIGSPSNDFRGTFDGNGKEIKNIYINRPNEDYVGLFGNGSAISRLGISGYILGNRYIGGICGDQANISYCCNKADVTGNCAVGGISGYRANVYHSYNLGNIKILDSNNGFSSVYSIGGIVANPQTGGIVKNSYNGGTIDIQKAYGAGGITGFFGNISNCINIGNIKTTKETAKPYYIGGISGGNNDTFSIKNSYNFTNLQGLNARNIGGILGDDYQICSNCYYLKGTATGGIDGKDIEGQAMPLEASEMPSVLSVLMTDNEQVEWNGQMVDVWKEDTNNINNGYPILFWQ